MSRPRVVAFIAMFLLGSSAAIADGPAISFRADPAKRNRIRVELSGLDRAFVASLTAAKLDAESASLWFSLRLESATDGPAILAKYSLEKGVVVLEPLYPIKLGAAYLARFDPAAAPKGAGPATAEPVVARFESAKPASSTPAKVVHVYPSANDLPENTLKFYIHFSSPMTRGDAYHRVRLLDAQGRKVEGAFLEIGEELWDPFGLRLTLLLDPGRIKKGLRPREELGPILRAGERYTLEVSADWRDAAGRPLEAAFRKTFRAGAEAASKPDIRDWKVAAPRTAKDPLAITFPAPLDHALLEYCISVKTISGRELPGKVSIDRDETLWRFEPDQPWSEPEYRVEVNPILEDLAGNSVDRLFEVDVFDTIDREKDKPKPHVLSFRIGKGH